MDTQEPMLSHVTSGKKGCTVPPTFNASWVVATVLCVWFLFIHAPFVLIAKAQIEPLLCVHLFGAYSVYLTCVHNTLLTPSTFDGAARQFHIWIGRAGLSLGVVGFITGFILTWVILDASSNLGFSIGITYGGLAQMQVQYTGYRAITRFQKIKAQIEASEYNTQQELDTLQEQQDNHLSDHILCMINLFVLACGIPALIRVVDAIGYGWLPILLVSLYFLSYYMAKPFVEKMKKKREEERNRSLVDEGTELNKYSFPIYLKESVKASQF